MLLATFGRERKPRVSKPSTWDWTKAWANRWWLVEAENADCARDLIAREEGELFDVRVFAPSGRILDCGRHGRSAMRRTDAPEPRPSRTSKPQVSEF